jgi:hypothetical protein
MNSAIGMVIASEKVPQGDSARALTTTSARTASRMIMIANTASSAAAPPSGPISSRAICPRHARLGRPALAQPPERARSRSRSRSGR